ncbi:MAG: ABC transporter permease [Bacteroidales bacterium]
MNTTLKIAWRNLWRNKRRTIITMSSVIFSVLFAAFMRSMQEGSYDRMIDNTVRFYSGYLQIQDSLYWDERTLDNTFTADPELTQRIEQIEDVLAVVPRIESGALAAYGNKSKPVFVMGISPEEENAITRISDKIIDGEFLTSDSEKALVSEGLARFLDLKTGDTLVMISQGYHGVSAAGKFAVAGVFKHPSPELNNNMVYLPIKAAGYFFSSEGRQTAQVVMVTDHYEVKHVKRAIEKILPPGLRVMTWDEMQPDIVKMIESDRAGGIFMLLILYLVIGFGIFGTVLMMVNERMREFGVIHALGMQKGEIALMLFFEVLLLGMSGALLGLLITAPVIHYFYQNPIPLTGDVAEAMLEYGVEPYMFFSIRPYLFINQALVIFIMSTLTTLIMMWRIFRFEIVSAIHK